MTKPCMCLVSAQKGFIELTFNGFQSDNSSIELDPTFVFLHVYFTCASLTSPRREGPCLINPLYSPDSILQVYLQWIFSKPILVESPNT